MDEDFVFSAASELIVIARIRKYQYPRVPRRHFGPFLVFPLDSLSL